MQKKPMVSAMKRETVKGGKVTKQVAVKTPSKKIMVMSENGKPQSLADRMARTKGMVNSLNAIAKEKSMGMTTGSKKMDASKPARRGNFIERIETVVKYPKKK